MKLFSMQVHAHFYQTQKDVAYSGKFQECSSTSLVLFNYWVVSLDFFISSKEYLVKYICFQGGKIRFLTVIKSDQKLSEKKGESIVWSSAQKWNNLDTWMQKKRIYQ